MSAGEAESVRRFCGLKLSGPIPDESTILHFRHLLERHQLGEALLGTINAHLAGQGLPLQAGTIVDASIIAAPSSTKNQARARPGQVEQLDRLRENQARWSSGSHSRRLAGIKYCCSAHTADHAETRTSAFLRCSLGLLSQSPWMKPQEGMSDSLC